MFRVCKCGYRVCLHQSWFEDQLGVQILEVQFIVESVYIRAFVLLKIFELINYMY